MAKVCIKYFCYFNIINNNFFLFPSIKLILFLDMPLSVKNGLIVPQNFFVSVMTFMSILL